jgi:hypothetical protein
MEWFRVLRPAATGLSLLAGAIPAAKLLRPFAAMTDAALKRIDRNPFRLVDAKNAANIRDVEADEETFIEHTLRFTSHYGLRPDWDTASLRFVLQHAEHKERHGAIKRRLVYTEGSEPVGGYIYYSRPGGIAWVLQIFSGRKHAGLILDSLFAHARNGGAAALRGRTHPLLMEALLPRQCLFFHRSFMLVRARDPAILEAALSANSLIAGLAAESWTRLIGGVFQ